jgi:hypothetical protein
MNEEQWNGNPMRHLEEIRYNHRSDIAPPNELTGRAFSENRIQGHSSGRAGGLSHQGLNRGSGMMEDHSRWITMKQ